MFSLYYTLGFNNPYYFKKDNKLFFFGSIKEVIDSQDKALEIDTASISQMLSLNHMLGDRTLIKGISKSPWMGTPNNAYSDFDYFKNISHKEEVASAKEISDKLYTLLRNEIKNYIADNKKIGILLSGGMDSRIVAGVLNDLVKDKSILVDSITAYTWGNAGSRDVEYSKRICELLGWQLKHYTVSSQDLWNNIHVSSQHGCEYSGMHLHALPQILEDIDVEIILAGSFGDSIGRAEYSGKKVTELKPFIKRRRNFGYLVDKRIFGSSLKHWQLDIKKYHDLFKENKRYQQYELDYQLHYMRRMLNPCIGLLNDKCKVAQAFTSPEIFQYIWSIHPKYRNDKIYTHILKKLNVYFSEIPWARTGLPYGKPGTPDNFKKNHHNYSSYIQNELFPLIESELKSSPIYNYINKTSVEIILRMIKTKPNYNFDYLERIIWLVSFSLFLKRNRNNLMQKAPTKKKSLLDNALLSLKYKVIHFGRKLRQ